MAMVAEAIRNSMASSDWPQQDFDAMHVALAEAAKAADEGEVPVGAVVTVDGEVIATGRNSSVTQCDPSAHAEIVAMRAAGRKRGNYRLTDATLYVTLEPCVMCAGAIVQARIQRIVFGAYDKKAGALGSVMDLSDSRALNHRFEINGGLLADECSNLLQEFFAARR
jgi:tRNA(adenine34) deaminase